MFDNIVYILSVACAPSLKRLKTNNGEAATVEGETVEGEEYEEAVQELSKEWKKGKKNRSQAIIKDLMAKTDVGRRNWITKEKPLIADVVLKFPCFSSSRMVCLNMDLQFACAVVCIL